MKWPPLSILSQILTTKRHGGPYYLLVVHMDVALINPSRTSLTINENALLHLLKLLWNVESLNGRTTLNDTMWDCLQARLIERDKAEIAGFDRRWLHRETIPRHPSSRQLYTFPIAEEIEARCLCFWDDPRHTTNIARFKLPTGEEQQYFDWMPKFAPVVTMLTYLRRNRKLFLNECGFRVDADTARSSSKC